MGDDFFGETLAGADARCAREAGARIGGQEGNPFEGDRTEQASGAFRQSPVMRECDPFR